MDKVKYVLESDGLNVSEVNVTVVSGWVLAERNGRANVWNKESAQMKDMTDGRLLLPSSLWHGLVNIKSIDSLNVFPVPDGDTGQTCLTVSAALKEAESRILR